MRFHFSSALPRSSHCRRRRSTPHPDPTRAIAGRNLPLGRLPDQNPHSQSVTGCAEAGKCARSGERGVRCESAVLLSLRSPPSGSFCRRHRCRRLCKAPLVVKGLFLFVCALCGLYGESTDLARAVSLFPPAHSLLVCVLLFSLLQKEADDLRRLLS